MQIEGDNISGYHKVGFNAGVLVDIYLKETMSISMEILYAQKGSATGSVERLNGAPDFKIIWDYVEVPIVFHYNDVRGMCFGGGIAPARLVRTNYFSNGIEDAFFFEGENAPNTWDVPLVLDLAYKVTPNFLANLRWSYSLFSLDTNINAEGELRGMYNNVVSLRAILMFSAQGEKKK